MRIKFTEEAAGWVVGILLTASVFCPAIWVCNMAAADGKKARLELAAKQRQENREWLEAAKLRLKK